MTALDTIETESKLNSARSDADASAHHALNFDVPIDARDQMNMAKAVVRALLYVGDCIRAHAAQQSESGGRPSC